MLPLYLVTAIVGGGLIVLAALGGLGHGVLDGFDTDHSVDFDHQVDVDHDLAMSHDVSGDHSLVGAHELAPTADFWLPFLTLRFWLYAVAGFGVFGTIASLLHLAAPPIILGLSIGFGVVAGTVVSYLMRLMKKTESDSSVREGDYVGVAGHVSVVPRNGEPGKIRMVVKGETIDMLALPSDGLELVRGEEVVVVGVEGTKVRVARLDDLMQD